MISFQSSIDEYTHTHIYIHISSAYDYGWFCVVDSTNYRVISIDVKIHARRARTQRIPWIMGTAGVCSLSLFILLWLYGIIYHIIHGTSGALDIAIWFCYFVYFYFYEDCLYMSCVHRFINQNSNTEIYFDSRIDIQWKIFIRHKCII